MKIALAGSSGNFGKLAGKLFAESGNTVTGISRDAWDHTDFSKFDLCFLSVPVTEVWKYLQDCGDCPVIEISSVKEPMRKYKGKAISIHPIFGPRSIGNPDFRNIIYVDDLSPGNGAEIISRLFPEFRLVHMTAEEHDRAMVDVLIKPFFMSRIASGITHGDLEFTGPSQMVLRQLASISASESPKVLEDTIRLNPYARPALKEIVDVSRRLNEEFWK